jgi:hypothetical protein
MSLTSFFHCIIFRNRETHCGFSSHVHTYGRDAYIRQNTYDFVFWWTTQCLLQRVAPSLFFNLNARWDFNCEGLNDKPLVQDTYMIKTVNLNKRATLRHNSLVPAVTEFRTASTFSTTGRIQVWYCEHPQCSSCSPISSYKQTPVMSSTANKRLAPLLPY